MPLGSTGLLEQTNCVVQTRHGSHKSVCFKWKGDPGVGAVPWQIDVYSVSFRGIIVRRLGWRCWVGALWDGNPAQRPVGVP